MSTELMMLSRAMAEDADRNISKRAAFIAITTMPHATKGQT